MHRKEFIDIILNGISDKFDIYHNYWFNEHKFVIYAYCYNRNMKFDMNTEAKLWDAKSYEHLFFINYDELDMESLDRLLRFSLEEIEPHFIRGDQRYPEKYHMYSYVSFIIISKNKPQKEVCEAIEKIDVKKNYMLSIRGFSTLRVACVTPSCSSVVSNRDGKSIANFLVNVMNKIDVYED